MALNLTFNSNPVFWQLLLRQFFLLLGVTNYRIYGLYRVIKTKHSAAMAFNPCGD